jgi:hypothetical protein
MFNIILIIILFIVIILIALNKNNSYVGGVEKKKKRRSHEKALQAVIEAQKTGGFIEDVNLHEEMRKEFIQKFNLTPDYYKEIDNGPDFIFHTPLDIKIAGKKQLINWISLEPYSYIDLPIVNKKLAIKLEQYDRYGIGCFMFPYHVSTDTISLKTIYGSSGCFIHSL